jgi:Xaa-Pro aminopeptidase
MKDGLPDTLTMVQWLSKHCKEGDRIGVDPNLYSTRQWNALVTAFDNEGCVMTAVKENLIDLVWDEQPAKPNNPVISLDIKFTGKSVADKLTEIRAKMSEQNSKIMVVTALDEIACNINFDKITLTMFFLIKIICLLFFQTSSIYAVPTLNQIQFSSLIQSSLKMN